MILNIEGRKPRRDLQEKAFRRYENYIACACTHHHFEVEPLLELERPMQPETFVARFKDAILGMTRYGYKSTVIPSGVDLHSLRAIPMENGKVVIINPALDPDPVRRTATKSVEKPSAMSVESQWTRIINHDVVLGQNDIGYRVRCGSEDDLSKLRLLVSMSKGYAIVDDPALFSREGVVVVTPPAIG